MTALLLSTSAIEHELYKKFKKRWQLVRHVLGGKDEVDAQGSTYLPKPNGYDTERFDSYQTRAVFYNATARTLDGYLGAIFRKEAEVNLPEKLKYLLNDTDGKGNNLVQFAKQVCRDVIAMGRHGVLVEYPQAMHITSLADERNSNMQAHLLSYTPESIVNWATTRQGSKTVLTSLLLKEDATEVSGHAFENSLYSRYRLLELDEKGRYVQRILLEKEETDPRTKKEQMFLREVETIYPTLPSGEHLDYIPFIFIGSTTFTPEPDLPPLYDLAQLNVAHYRNSADWEQAVFLVGLPTPYITGCDDKFIEENQGSLTIGSPCAWLLPDGATAGMLESKSNKQMILTAMDAKEAEMIGLGARIVQDNASRGSESTESIQLRRSGEASQLSCIADNVSQALVKAFNWVANWMDADKANIRYQLSKDFFAARLSHQDLNALVAAWQSGAIPKDTLFDNLRKGEIVSELESNETLRTKLEEEEPALGMEGINDADEIAESIDS